MTETELLDALRARPDDRGLRLVYADLLVERGDPRGELLILEEQVERAPDDTAPGWRAGAERLLHLAAEHGFPVLPDDPDALLDEMVDPSGGGGYPVQYDVTCAGRSLYLRYRGGGFSITDVTDGRWELLAEPDLPVTGDGEWTDAETNVVLHVVCEALRAGADLATLRFPDPLDADPRYRLGSFPRAGLPAEFSDGGRRTLRPRDHDRWWALHRRWQRTA